MTEPETSPRITHLSWGTMEIEGAPRGKDFMVYPGGAEPWDWTATNTQHEPGIQVADVEELLARGSRVVVLSRGMKGRLQVAPETLALLEERGVPVHVERTEAAVTIYNDLAEREAVGGLFHSTC